MESEEKIENQKEAAMVPLAADGQTEEKQQDDSLSCDGLLMEIHEGQVKMRPKWQFIIEQGLFAAAFLIIASIVFYLSSFIVFSLHQSGVIFLPEYGFRGWAAFFAFLPWPLIILVFLMLVLLELMVQQFAFAYHNPIVFTFGALLLIVVATSYLIACWHQPIYRLVKENHLPIVSPFYHHFSDRDLEGVRRGQINAVSGTTFIIEDENGATTSVFIAPDVQEDITEFREGNFIFIFGQEDHNMRQIQAFGIRQMAY